MPHRPARWTVTAASSWHARTTTSVTLVRSLDEAMFVSILCGSPLCGASAWTLVLFQSCDLPPSASSFSHLHFIMMVLLQSVSGTYSNCACTLRPSHCSEHMSKLCGYAACAQPFETCTADSDCCKGSTCSNGSCFFGAVLALCACSCPGLLIGFLLA
jgi:hypothetical protein